ncbi:hypothetical protein LVJ82_18170 [Vitreoscilla massiliensis]|uniref:BioF2-like acetyltransferase domain-containing protein n=1 Tax=Vitreoscilla massiliensis TaxID=1689272 RepID=A0ABY4E4W4_9NEIS|nr:hypothetical protein [Vitreoscilla massiliensis]UOO89343.1 hypothetical protein LVJ82_18170 [Vitreoscilla massiliensis]
MLNNHRDRTEAFAALLQQHPLTDLLHNAPHVSMDIVRSGDLAVPISVCHDDAPQTWVTSPLAMYADYTQEESRRHLPAYAAHPIIAAVELLKRYLRQQHFARAVTLNNWLISTNLYPALIPQAACKLLQQTREHYPQHALWWRSLNPIQHRDWLQFLQQQGCLLIPGRRIFILSDPAAARQRHRDWQHDARLQRNTRLHYCSDADFQRTQPYERVRDLYNLLYLAKYSQLNPQYSHTWMQALHQHGLLHLQGYADDSGELLGVAGVVANEATLTTPIFGFDTSVAQKVGLYRLHNGLAADYAIEQGLSINMSAGAGQFKQHRGAVACMEYSAVYAHHLPRSQQRAIRAVQFISQYVAAPLMQRLDM